MKQNTFNRSALERTAAQFHADTINGIHPVADLTSYEFFELGPLGELLALCAATSRQIANRGKQPPVKLKLPSSEIACDFLFKMQIFTFSVSTGHFIYRDNELGLQEQKQNAGGFKFQQHKWMSFRQIVLPGNQLLRSNFESQCDQLIRELQTLFKQGMHVELNYVKEELVDFWTPNYEAVENIYLHSGTWGFAGAQLTNNGMTIFYGDVGHGIKSTLEPHKNTLCEILDRKWGHGTAILGAFKRGITSKPEDCQGQGLDIIKQFVQKHNGMISCRSGDARVDFKSRGNPLVWDKCMFIPGVQLSIFLPPKSKN